MSEVFNKVCFAGLALVAALVPVAAFAQAETPTISGNAWVAIAIIVGLVLVILLFIGGALGISRRDKSDEDEAGVGFLEGIDEDDAKPKKKRK